jgi:hypothetical protein
VQYKEFAADAQRDGKNPAAEECKKNFNLFEKKVAA